MRRRSMSTPGPKPRPRAELPAEMPKMPRGVLPEQARKIWNELGPQLVTLGWLTALDGPAFMMLCIHAGVALDAAKELRGAGVVAEDERGMARKHPAGQILRDNSAAFRQYAAEFGLTPSSRARAGLPEPAGPSLADELMAMIEQGYKEYPGDDD